MDWFWAFLFTQIVEIPIYMRGLRAKPHEAFGASALTHPIVWFVIPPAWAWLHTTLLAPHAALRLSATPRYWVMVVIAETFAVVGEAVYFKQLGKEKAWRWAFVANMTSVTLGFACREIFGWP